MKKTILNTFKTAKAVVESIVVPKAKETANTAVIGASGYTGQAAAGAIAPGGFNLGFGMSSFAATNGTIIGTGSLAVSVSAVSVATAGAVAGAGFAAQGIVYSSSFNNNNFSNKNNVKSSNNASSGSSKTTLQGSSSGGGKESVKDKITGTSYDVNKLNKTQSYTYKIILVE